MDGDGANSSINVYGYAQNTLGCKEVSITVIVPGVIKSDASWLKAYA